MGFRSGDARADAEFVHAWSLAAVLTLSAIFWLLAWYGDTAWSAVAIWWRSETFAHGFLFVPISAWLIWRRRHAVAALEPRPNLLVLVPLALAGFGWLLGNLAEAGVLQQYCLVLMIRCWSGAFWAMRLRGHSPSRFAFCCSRCRSARFLQPSLMDYTADFTVAALRLSGIPVFRDGQFLMLPSGSWSVVEACSGLRYLIASLTLGFLYAYLTYRRLAYRAALSPPP